MRKVNAQPVNHTKHCILMEMFIIERRPGLFLITFLNCGKGEKIAVTGRNTNIKKLAKRFRQRNGNKNELVTFQQVQEFIQSMKNSYSFS